MAKRKQTEYIQGHATHRRTEGDYMGVLLDAVRDANGRAYNRTTYLKQRQTMMQRCCSLATCSA